MTEAKGRIRVRRVRLGHVVVLPIVGLLAGLTLSCGNVNPFSPAFVDLVDPDGTRATLDNAPGHVVITFVNNAEVDERLIAYLESDAGGGLSLTEVERRSLRPRVRFRVLVTFRNGNTTSFEFVDGSSKLIDQNFDARAFADLNQNDLDNAVVLCDVARVELLPGSSVEVFVPVELIEYRLLEVETEGGAIQIFPQVQRTIAPHFEALETDVTNADGNVVVAANIDIRDVAAPVINPACGAVVAIVMDGVLTVPFLEGVADFPSYSIEDLDTVAGIGGRYEFQVSIR